MLIVALLEGYLGYSLVDDLLSGMGLAIGYGGRAVDPVRRRELGDAALGRRRSRARPRSGRGMYIAHVCCCPLLIGGLLAAAPRARRAAAPHAVPAEPARRRERQARRRADVPGPGAALARAARSASPAVLVLLGGLVQINPIWLWGPVPHRISSTNGAQPDWYLGWLIGALRLMPGFDVDVGALHARSRTRSGAGCSSRSRLRLPLPLAVARAALHRRPGVPQPARPAARQPVAHRRSAPRWPAWAC